MTLLRPCFTCAAPTEDEICQKCAEQCHGYRRDSFQGDWCECGESLMWHIERRLVRATASPYVNPTAQHIMSIGKQPSSEGSLGVARAVERLSHFEPRLGASRFQP